MNQLTPEESNHEIRQHIALLRRHNAWRRGSDEYDMPSPIEIGVAMDRVCDELEKRIGGKAK